MGRAVIVGAGPAGTAAALALQRAGWEPEVFEAYDRSAGLDQGVFLTVAVNGLDALSAIGADAAVRELGFPTGRIRFQSGTGKDLGTLPIGPRLPDGTVTRSLRRADLYAALHELAVERGIPVHHGKRLRAATSDADGVTASFEDGTVASGDLLVGADGLRSTVRSVIDPRAPRPRYAGMGNVGALARVPGLDVGTEAADGDYRMIWGRRCFFGYTVSPDGEIWWFANPPARAELTPAQRRDGAAMRRHLLELFAADRTPAAEIVAGTPAEAILVADQHELPPVPTWRRGRMVLVGDAAHAVSPASGQGVSLACEDAVVLARCVRDGRDVHGALGAYEALRRERVERVMRWGARMGKTKTVGPIGRTIRDLVMPRFLRLGASERAQARQAWLYAHHLEWEADPRVRAVA
jgi:FAD-dependent urate hydroxylase